MQQLWKGNVLFIFFSFNISDHTKPVDLSDIVENFECLRTDEYVIVGHDDGVRNYHQNHIIWSHIQQYSAYNNVIISIA